MSILLTLIAGLGAIGILVVIHEFGHFIVAKLFRVGVPVFSVGMGPRLFGIRWRGTDYRLSAVPIGGYVRMAGSDPFGEESDEDEGVPPEQNFMRKPVWQRLLIMFAGPAFNLMLPVVLFTGAYMLGEPQADPSVGMVVYDSPAAAIGFREGDVIREVNGSEVELWGDVEWHFAYGNASDGEVVVERDGERLSLKVPAGSFELIAARKPDMARFGLKWSHLSTRVGVDDASSPAGVAGMQIGDFIEAVDGESVRDWSALLKSLDGDEHVLTVKRADRETLEVTSQEITLRASDWMPSDADGNRWGLNPVGLYIGAVRSDSAAEAAELQADDRILEIDGERVRDFHHLSALVRRTMPDPGPDATARPVDVVVLREGEELSFSMTPKLDEESIVGAIRYRPLLGLEYYRTSEVPGPIIEKFWSPIEAVPRAVNESFQVLRATFATLGALVTGQGKAQDSLGGPIEIFRITSAAASAGFFPYARLLGMISISLGIVNLLPVPVLDGGQIVFYAVEGLRGRPLSLAVRERLQMVGVLALVALMLLVFVFDINRAFFGG